ncbi:hypothetical protein FRC10_007783 [Ceratobasidium sp. 414]|nr:hypothetical protein FRC10_007783 [Ceratobasidium sp. 414]
MQANTQRECEARNMVQMQRDRPTWDDAALRALCEGLDVEMFGVGGYDKFIGDFISDLKDKYAMDGAERDNAGGDRVPPKAPRGLVISSRGGAALVSPSGPAQLNGLNGPSSPKGARPSTSEPGVLSLLQQPDDGTAAQAADEPTTSLDFYSPESQISESFSTILSTVHASTSSSSLPPSSPSASCSGQSESFVDHMIEQV